MTIATTPLGSLSEEARRTMTEVDLIWGRDIHRHRNVVVETLGPEILDFIARGA